MSAPMDPLAALWRAERDFAEPPPCCEQPRIFETRATVGGEPRLPIKVCGACGAWRFEFHNGWNPVACPPGFHYPEGAGLLVEPRTRPVNGSERFIAALESAVRVVDEPDHGYRAWIFHYGLPFARAGRLYAEFGKAELAAQWLRKALAIVLAPVVEELLAGPRCGCAHRDPLRCCEAALTRVGIPTAGLWIPPCPCQLCHAGEGGGP